MDFSALLNKFESPLYQMAVAVILTFISGFIFKLLILSDTVSDSGVIFWECSFAILLGYMMFNCIYSFVAKDSLKYFRNSIFSFVVLAIVGGVLSSQLSGLNVDEAGSFRWLYLVFTFVYLVFVSIVNLIKKFMEYAMKQEGRLHGDN